MNIVAEMKRHLLRAYADVAHVVGIFPAAIPLLLAGCAVEPVVDGNYRTVSEAPVLQTSPISMNLRAKLDERADFTIGSRVALVIGNGNYSGSVSSLANPANDAADIAAAMKHTGFDVDLQLDVNRDQMKQAVLDFSNKLHDSDVGLFYYAGHAVQVNGRNFLIPVDANLQLTNIRPDTLADYVGLESVEIDDVLGRMAATDPGMSIVILDACRDNPFSRGTRGITRGLAQTLAPRGTFVAYATAPGEVAEDGDGKNSPFTSALVETIKIPGLKLEDVFKQVRREVTFVTEDRQTPWENSSILGDFYFTPPSVPESESAAVAPPQPANRNNSPPPPTAARQAEEPKLATPVAKKSRSSSINTTFATP